MSRLREFERKVDETRADPLVRSGRVVSVRGTLVIATLVSAKVGELCRIEREGRPALKAEVVGFMGEHVKLMAFGALEDVASDARVEATGSRIEVNCGPAVYGRVLDALGEPIDRPDKPLMGPDGEPPERTPMMRPPPNAMERERIKEPMQTGIRAIDGMLTVGRGQRVGVFAGPGVGKSRLMSQIARGVDADLVVMALVGERGREVRAFVEDDLRMGCADDDEAFGRPPAVVVVSTSDEPALRRLKAAHTATAIAEHARSQGKRVILIMDSVTRFARALREVGLAADEPPGRGGYPASVYAELPRLVERAGWDGRGSITGFYTVLLENEKQEDEIASEVKSLLDGHIMLSPRLAAQSHYPAIDVLRSVSRLFTEVAGRDQIDAASRIRELLATFERAEDSIQCGVYKGGDPGVDQAIEMRPDIMRFFRQEEREHTERSDCLEGLISLGSNIRRDGEF